MESSLSEPILSRLETGAPHDDTFLASAEKVYPEAFVQEASAEEGIVVPTTLEEWVKEFPIKKLPPLPARSEAYRSEPCTGVGLVLSFACVLTLMIYLSVVSGSTELPTVVATVCVRLTLTLVMIALISLLFLLFGGAGEIRRSNATCYPIPDEVVKRLRRSESMKGLKNFTGPEGSATLGSYCVRCLVWRPPNTEKQQNHHCLTCQRCYRGFDHHCGVFGRCIVSANLVCFWSLIGMLLTGLVVTGATVFAANSSSERHSS